MKDTKNCSGCYNDFYNGRKNINGGKNCWSLKDSKLVSMYVIHKETTMCGYKKSWRRAGKKPNCFHGDNGYIYITKEEYNKLL